MKPSFRPFQLNTIITNALAVMIFVFLLNYGSALANEESCRVEPPFELQYGVFPDKTGKITKIKTAIAEYFRQSDGKALFYIVFYPYQIKPENWRDIFKYEKKSPSDFVVIKFEIRGSHPLQPGEYAPAESDISGDGNRFTPQLQIPGASFEGTRGSGKLVLESLEIAKHGRVKGYIDFKDSNFYIKGNFEALVYAVK